MVGWVGVIVEVLDRRDSTPIQPFILDREECRGEPHVYVTNVIPTLHHDSSACLFDSGARDWAGSLGVPRSPVAPFSG